MSIMQVIAPVSAASGPNSEAFYADLVSRHCTDSIVVTDKLGQTEWVNPAFERMSEYRLEELIGKKPGHVLQGPDTDPETVRQIASAIAQKNQITTQILNYTKTGAAYWIEITIAPVFDHQGVHTHFLSIERDITARRQHERELAAMIERDRLARDERRMMTQFSEWLYSSTTMTEVLALTQRAIGIMMPGTGGALYIYSNSRDSLELATQWGWNEHMEQPAPFLAPEECWSLRRGRAYHYGMHDIEMPCDHAKGLPSNYFCLPVMAYGETIGLLHLARLSGDQDLNGEEGTRSWRERWDLALFCAEQISLAIANVRLQQDLLGQSTRDALTDLWNRRWFLETSARLVNRAKKRHLPFSLISLDIDHFKRFNDSYGHSAGDDVLKAVARQMKEHFDDGLSACRLGGEEFVVLCPGLTADQALEMADGFRSKLSQLKVGQGRNELPPITISAGVSSYPGNGDNVAELIDAADGALYQAKSEGRDRCIMA